MKKIMISAIALAAMAGPALADDYYVVQDAKTKHCSIVSEKPRLLLRP